MGYLEGSTFDIKASVVLPVAAVEPGENLVLSFCDFLGFFFKEEGYSDERKSLLIMIRASILDVREAVEAQSLSLHGLWTEIGAGALEYYDPAKGGFYPV